MSRFRFLKEKKNKAKQTETPIDEQRHLMFNQSFDSKRRIFFQSLGNNPFYSLKLQSFIDPKKPKEKCIILLHIIVLYSFYLSCFLRFVSILLYWRNPSSLKKIDPFNRLANKAAIFTSKQQ